MRTTVGAAARRRVFAAAVAALLAAMTGAAVVPALAGAQRGDGRGNPRGGGPGGGTPGQRLMEILRDRLQLTDTQVERFRETNRRFGERRLRLGAEERQTRGAMRELICSGDTTRGAEMSRLIEQWQDLGRRRLELEGDEQRDLAAFLSPYQRARYLGFEEQLARLLDGRGGGRGGPPPDGARGRGRGPDGPPPGGGPGGRGGRGGPPPIPDVCGPVEGPPPPR